MPSKPSISEGFFMRSLPSKHSDSSRLCRASQSVYTHYEFQSVLYAMENALACRGNWRDAPRHSLQTFQGKCIPQTPGGFECHSSSFTCKMFPQNLSQNFRDRNLLCRLRTKCFVKTILTHSLSCLVANQAK